ncbi:MAG: PilZ domain-containing protein [Pseudomonadales bacterium]
MTEERRRYFRIDDSMGVSYQRLGAEEARVFAQQSREQGSNFDYAANFDNRIQTLLDACKIQAPVAAELIDLMNKKLNFVIQQMDIDATLIQGIAYTLRQVNVSACGMAFANKERLERGQQLQLDILLHPSELHVVAMAKVVNCEPLDVVTDIDVKEEGGACCFVRLNFTAINPSDQELLIQHIVKRQGAQLKQQRREQQS